MLPTKSGATINLETPNMTFAVRKDVIEIAYKVKHGIFLIVNVTRVDAERGMLFVNWGNYFRRLVIHLHSILHRDKPNLYCQTPAELHPVLL